MRDSLGLTKMRYAAKYIPAVTNNQISRQFRDTHIAACWVAAGLVWPISAFRARKAFRRGVTLRRHNPVRRLLPFCRRFHSAGGCSGPAYHASGATGKIFPIATELVGSRL